MAYDYLSVSFVQSVFEKEKSRIDFPFGRRAKPSRILDINLSDNLYIGKSRPD